MSRYTFTHRLLAARVQRFSRVQHYVTIVECDAPLSMLEEIRIDDAGSWLIHEIAWPDSNPAKSNIRWYDHGISAAVINPIAPLKCGGFGRLAVTVSYIGEGDYGVLRAAFLVVSKSQVLP